MAPEDGVYHFDLSLNLMPLITDYYTYLRYALMLHKGSDTVIERAVLMNPQTPFSPHHTLSISTTVLLNKGEVVYGYYRCDGEANATDIIATASFSGFLVAPITASSPGSNQIK